MICVYFILKTSMCFIYVSCTRMICMNYIFETSLMCVTMIHSNLTRVCVCVCVCVCMCVCVCVCVCVPSRVRCSTIVRHLCCSQSGVWYACVCVSVCKCARMYMCTYIYIYIYMHDRCEICMYIRIQI